MCKILKVGLGSKSIIEYGLKKHNESKRYIEIMFGAYVKPKEVF